MDFILAGLPCFFLTSFFAIVVASFFEHTLHRHLMHTKRQVRWAWINALINYAYNSHHVIHHGEFGAGPTYHHGPVPDVQPREKEEKLAEVA